MGGIPKYLEEVHPSLSAEDNIKNLCFEKSGSLRNEFDKIFSDIFGNRSLIYKKIVQCLEEGSYEYTEICHKLGIGKSGTLSEYFDDLIKSGFISRYYTWQLKNGKTSKLSQYRISDNYLRFYLKCIEPNQDKIERNYFSKKSLTSLPGWEGIMGLQFENLVLKNRHEILKLLDIHPEDVTNDNPYFQHKTTRQQSCQIDYMIQTKFNTLYLCEIKFSKHAVAENIIPIIQQKINKLKFPKGFSYRAVLIHVNGVTPELVDKCFFSDIIDFGELLENHHS